jgi:hypothetical protein
LSLPEYSSCSNSDCAQAFVAIDSWSGISMDGIPGYNVLRMFTAVIDYPNAGLQFRKSL